MSDRFVKGSFFLDTNIFIYSFDDREEKKQIRANKLIKHALETGDGTISYQVVQELINGLFKKFLKPISFDDAQIYLATVLHPMLKISSSISLFSRAIEIHERWKFSFYDSLIVAGALHAECKVLYSEDFQHGQKIESLIIQNPFL